MKTEILLLLIIINSLLILLVKGRMMRAFNRLVRHLLFLIPLLMFCSSYIKTFYRNGELLPLSITTKCGTYESKVIGVTEVDGIAERNIPAYAYSIFFKEDVAKLMSIVRTGK